MANNIDPNDIQALYQQYLKRSASDAEVQSMMGNPGGLDGIRQTILASPEYGAAKLQIAPNNVTTAGQNLATANNQTNGTAATQGGTTTPGYVNMADPAQAAVWGSFQSKGIQPRDANDFQYWVDKINQTGGWNNAGNQSYWQGRMAQSQGGVGDYLERPENGSTTTGSGTGTTTTTTGGAGASPTDLSGLLGAASMTPWTTAFTYKDWAPPAAFSAPTDVTMQNDPGYQFRIDQGNQAIQRSAAANGTLLTGGTLKDLQTFAQGQASQEYGNVWNRAFQNYTTNYNTGLTDWTTNYNKALQDYQTAYNVYNQQQGNQFNRLSSLAGLGQTAAGSLNSSGLGYANAIGNTTQGLGTSLSNLYTSLGNTQATNTATNSNLYANYLKSLGANLSSYAATS